MCDGRFQTSEVETHHTGFAFVELNDYVLQQFVMEYIQSTWDASNLAVQIVILFIISEEWRRCQTWPFSELGWMNSDRNDDDDDDHGWGDQDDDCGLEESMHQIRIH